MQMPVALQDSVSAFAGALADALVDCCNTRQIHVRNSI